MVITNDYFYLDGVRCDTVGLSCDTPTVPPMAQQSYTTWQTGADSPASTADNTFSPISYTLTARVFGSATDFDNSKIYAYVVNARTLSISRLAGYYFKILSIGGISPTVKADGQVVAYKISFTLAPFKYHLVNDEVSIGTSGSVDNIGTRYSRPLYKITDISGGGDVKLTVNGESFDIVGLDETTTTIFLDADKLLAYNQDNVNIMNNTVGQIPFLAVGGNNVTVSRGKVTVTGNWRTY